MSEENLPPEDVILGHFATYRFTQRFWDLSPMQRRDRAAAWLRAMTGAADVAHLYLTQGLETGSDVLLWSTSRIADAKATGAFFRRRAAAEIGFRDVLEPGHLLWGVTRPSEYSRAAKSAQEIDPFAPHRLPYLIMYPFTKTADWYLLGRETRQGMMNEHIRIGHQYPEVKQLLLYSAGLQDQEFVVVYETDDLARFSDLVAELRGSEARRYTERDTPITTALFHPDDEALALWE